LTEFESNKVIILPFQLRTEDSKRQSKEGLNLSHGVRVSNIDFDMTEKELHKLAADYGTVTHIDMNLREKGINRGFATVYFENSAQAADFVLFINGLDYRDYRLKGHLMQKMVKKE
jgi:RNA recognition motif-containing protein